MQQHHRGSGAASADVDDGAVGADALHADILRERLDRGGHRCVSRARRAQASLVLSLLPLILTSAWRGQNMAKALSAIADQALSNTMRIRPKKERRLLSQRIKARAPPPRSVQGSPRTRSHRCAHLAVAMQ